MCLSAAWIAAAAGKRDRPEANAMKAARLATLKFFALLFLLFGLAGLIASAAISTHYLVVMPRAPAPGPTPDEYRSVPRSIHGVTIYQTAQEDRLLRTWEYSSVGIFLVGVVLSVIYLEKWGSMQVPAGEEEERELAEGLR
ncbi:MAG: hypothetical protein P4K93_09805 [Terracidiphilus sp.]|nr:hypothetical protein [Terracidiphilus sp.]